MAAKFDQLVPVIHALADDVRIGSRGGTEVQHSPLGHQALEQAYTFVADRMALELEEGRVQ